MTRFPRVLSKDLPRGVLSVLRNRWEVLGILQEREIAYAMYAGVGRNSGKEKIGVDAEQFQTIFPWSSWLDSESLNNTTRSSSIPEEKLRSLVWKLCDIEF